MVDDICFSNGKLMSYCEAGRLPDDCTVGFIIGEFFECCLSMCV